MDPDLILTWILFPVAFIIIAFYFFHLYRLTSYLEKYKVNVWETLGKPKFPFGVSISNSFKLIGFIFKGKSDGDLNLKSLLFRIRLSLIIFLILFILSIILPIFLALK